MKTEQQLKNKRNTLRKQLRQARTTWLIALTKGKELHSYREAELRLETLPGQIDGVGGQHRFE